MRLASGVVRCRRIDVADALLDERREMTGLPRLTMCLVDH
jgi:hypothetical protein